VWWRPKKKNEKKLALEQQTKITNEMVISKHDFYVCPLFAYKYKTIIYNQLFLYRD